MSFGKCRFRTNEWSFSIEESIRLNENQRTSSAALKELHGVLRRIRNQQLLLSLGLIITVPFQLVVAFGAIPLGWYVMVVILSFESFYTSGLVLNDVVVAFRERRGGPKAPKGSTNTNTNTTPAQEGILAVHNSNDAIPAKAGAGDGDDGKQAQESQSGAQNSSMTSRQVHQEKSTDADWSQTSQ